MFAKLKYQVLNLTPRLHVYYDNKPSNPSATVLFLHGLAADSRTFDGVLEDISNDKQFRSIRAVALDLLGFGQSPSQDFLKYTLDAHLAAIDRAVQRLKITSPLFIVGHSMGGILAVKYAENHDITGLVLAAPPFLLPDEQQSLADRLHKQAFTKIEQNHASKSLQTAGKFIEKSTSFVNDYAHSKAFTASMKNIVIRGDGWAAAGKLKLPIRIIRGKFDSLTLKSNSLTLAKTHPNIRFIEVLSGHTIKDPMRAEIVKQLAELKP
jgi:pimeloyl-ACP methyl ester carboxylesterase